MGFYTQTNILCFQNVMDGAGFIRIDNIQDLYDAYCLFRRSTCIFFNTNMMDDVELLTSLMKRNRNLIPTSDELVIPGNNQQTVDFRQHILNLCLYYYLVDFHKLKGFPVYLKINNTWDNNEYELDEVMTTIMGMSKEIVRQIVFVYADGQPLVRVNRVKSFFTSPVIEVPTSEWEFRNTYSNMNDVFDISKDEKYSPDLMVNKLTETSYPVCYITQIGLGPVCTLKNILEKFTDAQRSIVNASFNSLESHLFTMMVLDDPYKKDSQRALDLFEQMIGWLHGDITVKINSELQLDKFSGITAFFCRTDPVTSTEELVYPVYSNFAKNSGFGEITNEEPESYIDGDTLEDFVDECYARAVFILNQSKPLLYTMPVISAPIPPRFVFNIQNMVKENIQKANNPEEVPEETTTE